MPSDELDVISFTPAMAPRARSSGVATVAAMVSGLAPGSEAVTDIVGKSTCGNGATDNRKKLMMPASAMPSVAKVVATGLWIKTAEKFISVHLPGGGVALPRRGVPGFAPAGDVRRDVRLTAQA